jgi:putative chitinase
MLTNEQLLAIMPFAKSRVATFLPFLNAAMAEFEINTPLRQAAFLAQIGHESGQLRYVKEIASGAAYEGRKDLGNTQPGDGVRFKGRGLIQITGRTNYTEVMMALDLDCLEHPEVLETPENACRTAAWWWHKRKLNDWADKQDILKITKIINGGTNGLEDRKHLYATACKVLGVT